MANLDLEVVAGPAKLSVDNADDVRVEAHVAGHWMGFVMRVQNNALELVLDSDVSIWTDSGRFLIDGELGISGSVTLVPERGDVVRLSWRDDE